MPHLKDTQLRGARNPCRLEPFSLSKCNNNSLNRSQRFLSLTLLIKKGAGPTVIHIQYVTWYISVTLHILSVAETNRERHYHIRHRSQ